MSIEHHPNFHAVKFVSNLTASFYESLRGDSDASKIDNDRLRELIMQFAESCEDLVDASANRTGGS